MTEKKSFLFEERNQGNQMVGDRRKRTAMLAWGTMGEGRWVWERRDGEKLDLRKEGCSCCLRGRFGEEGEEGVREKWEEGRPIWSGS